MVRDVLISEIKKIIPNFCKKSLLCPNRPNLGDYAIHLLTLQDNIQIERIISHISSISFVSGAKIINGFVNIFISKQAVLHEIDNLKKKETYYAKETKKILFEYGDPNTHKLPHIGHFFSYFFGESCSRLLEATGNTVYRANYQGDIGLHVAKALYAYKKKFRIPNEKHLEEFVRFLQKCYQEGSKWYEENQKDREKIDELNKKIYQKDQSVVKDWIKTRKINLAYYRKLEKQFGILYDKYYYESDTFKDGLSLVKKNIGSIFTTSEGAVIFKGEQYGLHTRVFINKHGYPTYEGKDIGLMMRKIKDFTFDLAIIDTASEQNEYWNVVKKAIELIFPEMKNKVLHLGHGMISLKSGGKMSSRTGNIISAIDLITEIQHRIRKKYYPSKKVSNKELQILTFASLKYSFLKSDWRKNMTFDIDESINLHGNSGLYLLYTYARCKSVIVKSKAFAITPESITYSSSDTYEEAILRHLIHYPEVVLDASSDYCPHLICVFLYQLARKYNDLYENKRILKTDSEKININITRLYITHIVSHILKHGLGLLGINTLEKL